MTTDTEQQTPGGKHERIVQRHIEREMKESYLTYALSVIHSRALPDVRDGLKPSQRRILVAMNDLNLSPRARYRKCAKVAGDTSGNYHPHGESVIYPTLVRMAQDFSLRYPLIDGQGNFGSIDGDPPAAMRYTEARMSGIAVEMMTDLDKETVEFEPNYDETRTQPSVLPSRFPNLLCNGSDGIAVGMATSLPPHNLREICAGLRAVLDDPSITLQGLLEIIPGPDFPTGGIIMGKRGIMQAYGTGRGLVRLRARYTVEDIRTKQQIVISEIPYQVKKTTIIEKIVDVVKDGRITGISDVRDESDRHGIRLVIELKKGEDSQVVINQLFKYTPLQTTRSIINLAIDDGQPRTLTLRALLDAYLRHRREVLRRRTTYLLRRAEERKHIVDGLRIAVANIDRVIEIVRGAKDRDDAKSRLSDEFGLSDRQSQAIVDMRLGSLTGLEREKLEAEHAKLLAEIQDLNDILSTEGRVTAMIREDIDDLDKRYGDARRTEISSEEIDTNFDIEELITEDLMVVTFSRDGYVKRIPLDTYRAQARGGRGVRGSDSKEGDVLKSLFVASTHDYLLYFSNFGQVFWLKTYNLPEAGRTSKGRAIANLLPLREGERITGILRVPEFDSERSVVFVTRRGIVKKTALEAYSRPKRGGIRAILLQAEDEVVSVALARPGDSIMICSRGGRCVHFDEAATRNMGRTSRGVRGMRLRGGDEVVGMVVADPAAQLLTASVHGYGKRTPVTEYAIKGRGNQGVISIKTNERNGPVVSIALCREGDDALFITENGMIVRSSVSAISSMGRATQGVRLVNLKADDRLVSVEIVSETDLERFGTEDESGDEPGAEPTGTEPVGGDAGEPKPAAEVGGETGGEAGDEAGGETGGETGGEADDEAGE
ncbi:MAG: DNA gyrase subunit A [Planctomycetota bacterium]|nr:MAG: DNA gyrase subunit A [Planctomycetota bacterium]